MSLRLFFGEDAGVLREQNFQLLLLATVLPVMGNAIVSPVLSSLIDPLGATTANIGLMVSVFTAPAIVTIPAAGVVADRVGRKPVLVGSLLLFSLAGVAVSFATDFAVVLGLRALQGLAFGGINPVIITSIGDFYDGEKEATGQGLRFTVSGLSGAVFPFFAGFLVVVAWQYPFFLFAVGIPIAIALSLWFDDPTGASDSTGSGESYSRELVELVRRRRVLSIVVARSLPNVVWFGFLTYISIVVVTFYDGTPPQAGALVALASFTFSVTATQSGRLTAAFDRPLLLLVGSNVCLGVGFASILFAPSIELAAGGVVVTGVGFGVVQSLYRSIITGLAPETLRGGLVSLAEAGGRATSTVTPIAMGGAISVMTPTLGFGPALQLAGVGVAVVGGGGGVLCLLVASASPPAPAESSTLV